MKRNKAQVLPLLPAPYAFTLFLPLLWALLFCLTGCGPNSAQVLQAGLEQGDSLVIFPLPGSAGDLVRWQRLTDNLNAEENYVSAFAGAVRVGGKYAAVTVKPGTYFIRGLDSRSPAAERKLDGKRSFASRFGDIRVVKTPARAYAEERVWEPPEYERIGGRLVRVWDGYWVTRVVSRRQTSYLVSSCDFLAMPDGGPDLAAEITVEPGEVLLIPGVWAGIEVRDGSCAFKGHEVPESYRQLAGRSGFTAYTGGGGPEDSYFNQIYACPLETLSITVIQADLNDLRQWADPGDFPPGVLERAVRRELKPGRLFEGEHQIREVSREETHLFSPNVIYSGTEHIFRGETDR